MSIDLDKLYSISRCSDDIGIVGVDSDNFSAVVSGSSGDLGLSYAAMMNFGGGLGEVLFMPSSDISERIVYVGFGDSRDYILGGRLADILVGGRSYYLSNCEVESERQLYDIALGWGLHQYSFVNFREQSFRDKVESGYKRLVLPAGVDKERLYLELESIFYVRDLINSPANELSPEVLLGMAEDLAGMYGASFDAIIGDDLLERGFPLIHAVGRASESPACLAEINYSASSSVDFRLTLVGKGVCFDSGGLNIKPDSNMFMMKKDMGGCACVMGLARLLMGSGLNIGLRVLLPIVENSISGSAYRPSDILRSRSGKSVEVGNTDAEGRLILADALSYACEGAEKPDMLIDFATLTGAARVAVGTEITAMFANRCETSAGLLVASETSGDFLWGLPLHGGYRGMLDCGMADISSTGSSSYGGAITAALFLQEFVDSEIDWVHFDMMGWNVKGRLCHPVGGEAMGMRSAYEYIVNLVRERVR